jgi:hypothetical protein
MMRTSLTLRSDPEEDEEDNEEADAHNIDFSFVYCNRALFDAFWEMTRELLMMMMSKVLKTVKISLMSSGALTGQSLGLAKTGTSQHGTS